MSRIKYLFIALLIFTTASQLNGQSSRYLLTIDNVTIGVQNLLLQDSLVSGNKTTHAATIDLQIGSGENLDVLKKFQSYFGNTKNQLSVTLSIMNFDGKLAEERIYNNLIVEDIILPAMDATTKTPAKAQVKIRSLSMTLANDTKKTFNQPKKQEMVLTGNFKFSLGDLPSNRVAKISQIRFVNMLNGQYSFFTIEVAGADLSAWQNRLLSGSQKKEEGSIEWLMPNIKDVLMKLELKEVEIVSITTNLSSTSETISRATIGLRMRKFNIVQ